MLLGLLQEETKNWEEAVRSYTTLLEKNPNWLNARGRLANILVYLGRPKQALEQYSLIEKDNKLSKQQLPILYKSMGIAHQQANQNDEAIHYYT